MEELMSSQQASSIQGADGTINPRQQAARLMGLARSEAKQRAAQANGRKGGRPKGFVVSAETRARISLTKLARTKPNQADTNQNAEDEVRYDLAD